MTEIKNALCRLLGHRARFLYDDLLGLFRYEGVVAFIARKTVDPPGLQIRGLTEVALLIPGPHTRTNDQKNFSED